MIPKFLNIFQTRGSTLILSFGPQILKIRIIRIIRVFNHSIFELFQIVNPEIHRWEWNGLELELHSDNDVVAKETLDNLDSLTGEGDATAEEEEEPEEATQTTARGVGPGDAVGTANQRGD